VGEFSGLTGCEPVGGNEKGKSSTKLYLAGPWYGGKVMTVHETGKLEKKGGKRKKGGTLGDKVGNLASGCEKHSMRERDGSACERRKVHNKG